MSFSADPEIAKWINNVDFRRALSLGIDRNQMNETFWLGLGTPGSTCPAESMPQNPGQGMAREMVDATTWRKANQLLDKIGLNKKDSEGFRLRTDNGQRLRIQVQTVRAFLPWPQQMEMVAQHWRKIGIFAEVREMERMLAFKRTQNNEHHIMCGPMAGRSCSISSRATPSPLTRSRRSWGRNSPNGTPPTAQLGREPTDAGLKKIFELFRSAAGQKEQQRNDDRPGDLAHPGRQRLLDRHGRPVAGPDGRAPRQPQVGQHPGARLHRPALPDTGHLAA